jgi:glycosyltransferase involved in cell wall biosynthesis
MVRKRILITARLYGAGGIETHLLNLSRMLVGRGAEITLVTRFANPETPLVRASREIPVQIFDTPFARDLRWFRLSTAWAMTIWPWHLPAGYFDVLYTLEISRFTPFLRRFVRPDGFVIANGAGGPLRGFDALDPVGRRALNGFIVESEIQAAPVQRSSNGVRVAAIPHLGLAQDVPERRPRAIHCFRVAFLGRYARGKGVYRLLDLWPACGGGLSRLDFYGHGAEREGLERAIRERGMESSVAVHGGWSSGEELAAIMDATDLVVLPSESEGLPLVLLEAMAHGVPFVSSDVGAVRTLAEGNPDVRVVPLETTALVRAIREMERQIRAGRICGRRLQEYHRARYGYEHLASLWSQALLEPESFWCGPRGSNSPRAAVSETSRPAALR